MEPASSSSVACFRLFLAFGGADEESRLEAAQVGRFLDCGEAAVISASSSTAAHFRLPLLNTANSSTICHGFPVRWPRPVAEVIAKSPTMSMTRSLGIWIGHTGRLAGTGSLAAGVGSALDSPGDRAAHAAVTPPAVTPPGAFVNVLLALSTFSLAFLGFFGACPVFSLLEKLVPVLLTSSLVSRTRSQ